MARLLTFVVFFLHFLAHGGVAQCVITIRTPELGPLYTPWSEDMKHRVAFGCIFIQNFRTEKICTTEDWCFFIPEIYP
jgi:hypothetical protein